jgi:hypothetical protein
MADVKIYEEVKDTVSLVNTAEQLLEEYNSNVKTVKMKMKNLVMFLMSLVRR